jgi:hypothetical protein
MKQQTYIFQAEMEHAKQKMEPLRNASRPWHQQQHGNLQHQSISKQHDIAGIFL